MVIFPQKAPPRQGANRLTGWTMLLHSKEAFVRGLGFRVVQGEALAAGMGFVRFFALALANVRLLPKPERLGKWLKKPERTYLQVWWSIDWHWDWSSTAWDPLGVPGSTRGVPGLCILFWKCDLRAAVLTRAGCHCLCLWPQRPQGLRTPSNRVLVYL